MKRTLHFLFLFLVKFSPVLAQTFTLTGKVVDNASKRPLAGVSVQAGPYHGTLTNNKGAFRLNTSISLLRQSGLSFTYVGYKKVLLPYKGDSTYTVGMEVADNKLTEVVVYADGRAVLEKAIARIPANYSQKPAILNGIIRIYNTVNDSDYFYRSDGIVRIYYPPYTGKNGNPQIRLIQNKQVLIRNPGPIISTIPCRRNGSVHTILSPTPSTNGQAFFAGID
jgi:CarboxypepD_reg-like domain